MSSSLLLCVLWSLLRSCFILVVSLFEWILPVECVDCILHYISLSCHLRPNRLGSSSFRPLCISLVWEITLLLLVVSSTGFVDVCPPHQKRSKPSASRGKGLLKRFRLESLQWKCLIRLLDPLLVSLSKYGWDCYSCWGSWFWSRIQTVLKEQVFISHFCRRKVIVGRVITLFALSSQPFSLIPYLFQSREWPFFATTPPNVFVDMVREFYSNISSYQSKTTSLTTFVRGINITITPSSLVKILNAPDL